MPKKEIKPQRGISWSEVIAIFSSITGFVTSVIAWLDIAQYGQMGYQNFLWAGIVAAVVVWGIILWLLYKQKNIAFSIGLAITMVAVTIVGIWWTSNKRSEEERIKAREEKFIVVIAKFDDANSDYYLLRNEIYDKLEENFSNDSSVLIEKIDETVTEDRNSDSLYARELGENYQADLVIWGSYRNTINPNMKIHVENLTMEQLVNVLASQTLHPDIALDDLKSFTFQQEIGDEASALVSFFVGFIDYFKGNYETALTHFDQALNITSSSPAVFENQAEIYFYRGTTRFQLKDYLLALDDYTKAIKINSEIGEIYFNRGAVYLAMGEYLLAITDYDQAISLNINYAGAYNNRGLAYKKIGEYNLALADYDQAIKMDPNVEVFYSGRGVVYDLLGADNLAIADFDKALELNPNYYFGIYNRGNVYLAQGDYPKAILDYSEAIEIDPLFGLAYVNRGNAYQELKDLSSAIRDYDQALVIDANNEDAFNNRGNAYIDLGEYSRAIADYDQAIRLNPKRAEFYFNRGLARGFSGDYLGAINDLSHVIELNNPQLNSIAYYSRGLAYTELGKTNEAEADFAKYKELTGRDAP